MKITIRELRQIISEEVDRMIRNSAGFGGSAGVGGAGIRSSEAPPGLGDAEYQEKENEDYEEQEKSQFAQRIRSRGATSGQG